MTKALTLRLSDQQAQQLEALAQIENQPVAEVIREAIAREIEARRRDSKFQRRLRASLERHQRILEELADR